MLRRALLTTAVTGLGVASSLGPAVATPTDRQPTVPADLGWGAPPTPVDDGGRLAPAQDGGRLAPAQDGDRLALEPVAPPTAPAAATSAAHDAHVVRPGDSLWSISATHLPDGATAAEVAQAWPRWYEANLQVVGADPDLIRPGQHLRAPDEEAS